MQNLEQAVASHPGYLDSVTKHAISGWARDPEDLEKKVTVKILVNDTERFQIRANMPRGDFIGPHGFLCQVPGGLDSADVVRAIIADKDQELGFSPGVVGQVESLLSLYSPRHDYIVYYNAKAACTLLRMMFSELHKDEASQTFDIGNARIAFKPPRNKTPDAALALVRNPYTRCVSAFLDKVVSWCYHRESCRAHRIFAWQFSKNRKLWPELTFLDYLNYLAAPASRCSDIHFWAQPNYADSITLCKVEDLFNSICGFYSLNRPTLLPGVEAFLKQHRSPINPSRNSAATNLVYIEDAARLSIREIAKILEKGQGIEPLSFFDETSKSMADNLFSVEMTRCLYRFPW